MPKSVPFLPVLQDFSVLVKLVSDCVRLPHPAVVSQFPDAVFPSIRDQKNRLTVGNVDEKQVLLDDNTTPRWAFLWSHGISITAHPTGWTFAHVWALPKELKCYTHLANLVMMPEYLASLSDKDGPLSPYLRFHAQEVYGWRPESKITVSMPHGFEEINWLYLEPFENSRKFVEDRVKDLKNQRCKVLREIMVV